MIEHDRPSRFRFRLGTVLLVIAIVALLLVVVIQQVQIARMREQIGQMKRTIDVNAKSTETLTVIIRELRGHLERQK
jgi:hypothetical protein